MLLGELALLGLLGRGVDARQDLHALVVARTGLEDLLEAVGGVLGLTSVQVGLPQAEVGQDEGVRVELGGLVVVSVRLLQVALDVVRARQLVARLGANELVLRVVERVYGQLLN